MKDPQLSEYLKKFGSEFDKTDKYPFLRAPTLLFIATSSICRDFTTTKRLTSDHVMDFSKRRFNRQVHNLVSI